MKFGIAAVDKKKKTSGKVWVLRKSIQWKPLLQVQIKFCPMRDFKLRPQTQWDLRSSELLSCMEW